MNNFGARVPLQIDRFLFPPLGEDVLGARPGPVRTSRCHVGHQCHLTDIKERWPLSAPSRIKTCGVDVELSKVKDLNGSNVG